MALRVVPRDVRHAGKVSSGSVGEKTDGGRAEAKREDSREVDGQQDVVVCFDPSPQASPESPRHSSGEDSDSRGERQQETSRGWAVSAPPDSKPGRECCEEPCRDRTLLEGCSEAL